MIEVDGTQPTDTTPWSSRRHGRIGLGGRIAIGLLIVVLGVAFIGPLVAPHEPDQLLGAPFETPSDEFPLGTDYIGGDVLSRTLSGGRSLVWYAALATLLSYVFGLSIGLAAGARSGVRDGVLMRSMDVMLAFPPILFILLLAAGIGSGVVPVVVGVAVVNIAPIARIVRTSSRVIFISPFVEASQARGDSTFQILRKDVLPNMGGVLAADLGPRFASSILIVAALNFLGLGLSPPAADWALMVSENRPGITTQPWGVVAPAALIAILGISVSLVADAFTRSAESSVRR